jgi:polyisoprenoid-binding protein YceI
MTRNFALAARALVAAALTLTTASAVHAATTTYEIDKTHSSIQFKIRHLLSKTAGQFGRFAGTVTLDPEARDTVEVSATIEAASIDTDDAKRDDHLRAADFFDVAQFPKLTFTGGKLSEVNADRTRGKLEGTLTIKGVAKPVVLDVEWFGTAVDPWGNQKAAFAGKTTINRKDFGIVYNKVLDNGGYLIGDEVEIEINVEAQIPKAK